MSGSKLAIVTMVVVLLGETPVQAQQPQKPDSMAPGMMAMNCMRSSGADQRLSQLVDAMNAAPSNRRIAAMMAVINELATRNREMHAHMAGMMHGMQMPGMGQGMQRRGMMQPGDSGGAAAPMRKAPSTEPVKPSPDSAHH